MSEVVGDFELIGLEGIDRFDGGERTGAFEPGGGAPAVLAGGGGELMMHRVVVDVVETGKIGAFKRQASVPIVVPDFT